MGKKSVRMTNQQTCSIKFVSSIFELASQSFRICSPSSIKIFFVPKSKQIIFSSMKSNRLRQLTETITNNTSSSLTGLYSQSYEYEIHRLYQEQLMKQRQRQTSQLLSYRYYRSIDTTKTKTFFYE